VPTTIWFALGDGKVYFVTGPSTGKAKRMRGTPRVMLGPSTPRGKPTSGESEWRPRQLDDAEAGVARDLLLRKYGIQFRILHLIQFLSRARPVYFELSLVR
jgi:PPOX class probable F420-dependent enzyme